MDGGGWNELGWLKRMSKIDHAARSDAEWCGAASRISGSSSPDWRPESSFTIPGRKKLAGEMLCDALIPPHPQSRAKSNAIRAAFKMRVVSFTIQNCIRLFCRE